MTDTAKDIHDDMGNHGDDIESNKANVKKGMANSYNKIMDISKYASLLLNLNAAILISVFVICYAIFH